MITEIKKVDVSLSKEELLTILSSLDRMVSSTHIEMLYEYLETKLISLQK